MKKNYTLLWVTIFIGLLMIWSIIFLFIKFPEKYFNINHPESINFVDDTWDNVWEYTKLIIKDKEWFDSNELSEFPIIKVNNTIKDIRLIAEISFTNDFMDKYKYEDSTGYFFALKFFVWDESNWWYYNVYRKNDWSVGNSKKNWLLWAKLAYEIKNGATRYITLNNNVPVAVDTNNRSKNTQYKYLDIENYINTHLWAELSIWVYLSSVHEKDWWEITKINSLKIVYVWNESDVEVIKDI